MGILVLAFCAVAVLGSQGERAQAKKAPKGSLTVIVDGLSSSDSPQISVTGPKQAGKAFRKAIGKPGKTTFKGLSLGSYTVVAKTVQAQAGTATPKASSQKLTLTRKAPKRSLTVSYLVQGPYTPPSTTPPSTTPPSTTPPSTPSTPTRPLRFNISSAVALATGNASLPSGRSGSRDAPSENSNLVAVTPSGETVDAVTSTTSTINVGYFLIDPFNDVYVVFNGPVDLETGRSIWDLPEGSQVQGCVLAKIDRSTGVPTCVDSSLDQVYAPYYGSSNLSPPAVQFGEDGSIYYMGFSYESNSTISILRKKSPEGVITSLVPPSARLWIQGFFVLPGGRVALRGSTQTSGGGYTQWTRLWSPSASPQGTISTIANVGGMSWIARFSDGNLYYGSNSSGSDSETNYYFRGIRRFLSVPAELDPRSWTKGSYSSQSYINPPSSWPYPPFPYNPLFDPHNVLTDPGAPCHGLTWNPPAELQPLCGGGGDYANIHLSSGGRDFLLLTGWSSSGQVLSLTQVFPTVRALTPTPIRSVTQVALAGNTIYAAGTTGSEENVITSIDVESGIPRNQPLVDSGIEVYDMEFIETRDEVIFLGNRFIDNTYVAGRIDINSGSVAIEPIDVEITSGSLQSFSN